MKPAAEIAIKTVAEFLKANNGTTLKLVQFTVFNDVEFGNTLSFCDVEKSKVFLIQ
jgi:hypothetical protein